MIPRLWESKFSVLIGGSTTEVLSKTSLLHTYSYQKAIALKVNYNRKTYDSYRNETISLAVVKPINKTEYPFPTSYELIYQYNFQFFDELFFLSPLFHYKKDHFINLINFGRDVNVLPFSIIWTGVKVTFENFIKLSLSYKTVLQGDLTYSNITAPIIGSTVSASLLIPIYKNFSFEINHANYTIETEIGSAISTYKNSSILLNYLF